MRAASARLDEARREVVHVYRELGRLGLNTGSSGNVSRRLAGRMLITATGTTAETITETGLVVMGLDGSAPAGARPSSEWEMHARIYQADESAGAIVHTHADACTALACLGEALPPFHYMLASFGGDDVRCSPYVTFGTTELARVAAEAIAGRTACLLANHGMIVLGRDPRAALDAAIRLETLSRQYLLARSAGTPRLLSRVEMDAARERFRTYGK